MYQVCSIVLSTPTLACRFLVCVCVCACVFTERGVIPDGKNPSMRSGGHACPCTACYFLPASLGAVFDSRWQTHPVLSYSEWDQPCQIIAYTVCLRVACYSRRGGRGAIDPPTELTPSAFRKQNTHLPCILSTHVFRRGGAIAPCTSMHQTVTASSLRIKRLYHTIKIKNKPPWQTDFYST